MKNNERVSGMNPRDMTYDEWLAKFDDNNKPKTSDDTFTPPAIYEIVKNYAIKKYGLEGRRVVRPFYPGGDYQNFNYKEGDVVIDNPPFSILKKIKSFYVKNKIDFFLFAPGLMMFNKSDREMNINYIMVGETVKFENGAKVPVGFATNLGDNLIETAPELAKAIRNAQNTKKVKPSRIYPPNVITSARINAIARKGVALKINGDVKYIAKMDAMKSYGMGTLFGGGLLLKNKEAKKIIEAEKTIKEKPTITLELSEREKEWCSS